MATFMQSNHFVMSLIGTYHVVFAAAGVSTEEVIAGARRQHFNLCAPRTVL